MQTQTTSAAFLDALHEAGITFIFANLGSDHPSLLEALEDAKAHGRPVPRLVTCPNEMVALSAAHGCALATGQPQAVMVHVECGTQALAGAVHNAARGRVPVLIFAGASPLTQEGELRGSRNEFIHWIQDVRDQRGILRGYMKYDNEIRAGHNIRQVVRRALQIAASDPKGPVYLMAAREILEQEIPVVGTDASLWRPISPGALCGHDLDELISALCRAERPLIVTSHLGRNVAAVGALERLVDRLAIPVLESAPSCLNLSTNHPMYIGNQWNQQEQNPQLAQADLVLVIDSDVPWIPLISRPSPGAVIYHIDVDPLKEQMPLWYLSTMRSMRADAHTALSQINAALDAVATDSVLVTQRRDAVIALHQSRAASLLALEVPSGDAISPEHLTACLRPFIDADTVVCNEGISNYHTVINHLGLTRPGSMLTSGGGSLGWNGGAAFGVRLAQPGKKVLALCGDGSYMFSVPSTVHWMARRYSAPFLTVIYNNGGWKSPKLSALAVHPDGYASKSDDLGVSFDPAPDYAAIAAASGGAHARKVTAAKDLGKAIAESFAALAEGHSAVLDVVVGRL